MSGKKESSFVTEIDFVWLVLFKQVIIRKFWFLVYQNVVTLRDVQGATTAAATTKTTTTTTSTATSIRNQLKIGERSWTFCKMALEP